MIRKLASDELVWYLSRSLAFQGHSDPMGLAQRLRPLLHDPRHDAESTFLLVEEGGPPVAGASVRAPHHDDDDQSLRLAQLWFEDDPDALRTLVGGLFERFPHEAVYLPLHGVLGGVIERLGAALAPFGFERVETVDLAFELSETPPIGRPLVLEAWTLATDAGFREVYEGAEGERSDATWAWLKRLRGPFYPDLWLLARETLDQEPVGYAFVGAHDAGGAHDAEVDASYYLTAVGVAQAHRHSTEMLRRLVLSLLHELAARSPLGRIDTSLDLRDPKLVRILYSLGFEEKDRYAMLIRRPA